jgi:hypothetical protein
VLTFQSETFFGRWLRKYLGFVGIVSGMTPAADFAEQKAKQNCCFRLTGNQE